MRVMIYEELLVFKSGKHTCHPQILSTDKLINDEGSRILRADFGKKDWVVNLTRPDFLCRLKHIRITVTPPITPQMNARLNNVLYPLCGFLAGDHQIKQFTLDIRSMNPTVESELYHTILAPLAMLKCSEEMKILVANDKTMPAPTYRMDDRTNYLHHRGFPLKRGINTWKEVQELGRLTQKSMLTCGPQQVNWVDNDQRQFYNARADLQELLKGGQYFNSIWESKIGIAAGLVRGGLCSFNVPAVIKEQEESIRKAQESLSKLKALRIENRAEEREHDHRVAHRRRRIDELRAKAEAEEAEAARKREHFYKEAMPVLYDGNPVSINIAVRDRDNDEHSVTTQGLHFDPIRLPLGPSGLPLTRWALGLHHIKRLLVRALPCKEPRKRAGDPRYVHAAMFNHVLYSLSSSLAGDNSLTELWVDMRNAPVGDGDRKYRTTYPLVMFGALDEIAMTVGRAEPTILRHCAVSDTSHAGDTLTPAQFAFEEAEVWECLAMIAGFSSPGRQSSAEYRASFNDWNHIQYLLHDMRPLVDDEPALYQIFDADWDTSVRGLTTPLQALMNAFDVTSLLGEEVDGFQDLLDSIGEWEQARTMYGSPRLANAKRALEVVSRNMWKQDTQQIARVEAFFKRCFAIMEDFPFGGEQDGPNVGVLDESSFSESSEGE